MMKSSDRYLEQIINLLKTEYPIEEIKIMIDILKDEAIVNLKPKIKEIYNNEVKNYIADKLLIYFATDGKKYINHNKGF